MSDQFASTLHDLVLRLDRRWRQDHECKIAALWDAGGTSYAHVLALAEDAGHERSVRLTAIWVLGLLHDKRAVPALLTVLTDRRPDVRCYAAIGLGALGDRRAAQPLIAVMQMDAEVSVRQAAAAALRWCGGAATVAPLVQTVRNGAEDARVRGEAAESLGELGQRDAVLPLIAALSDPAPEVRLWSAFALGVLGDARAVPHLERVAAADTGVVSHLTYLPSKGAVRQEAQEALARISSDRHRRAR